MFDDRIVVSILVLLIIVGLAWGILKSVRGNKDSEPPRPGGSGPRPK